MQLLDDSIDEGWGEQYKVWFTTTSADPRYVGVISPTQFINVHDNDSVGVVVSSSNLTVMEGDIQIYEVIMYF